MDDSPDSRDPSGIRPVGGSDTGSQAAEAVPAMADLQPTFGDPYSQRIRIAITDAIAHANHDTLTHGKPFPVSLSIIYPD